jgi:hypothetical protein
VRRALDSTDDQLLWRLQAPPHLTDGIESLAYWHDRRRRLSWYRIRARREAAKMILRWEHRVRRAMFSQRGASIADRSSAGLLLARTRIRRWSRRAAIALTAMVGIAVLAAPLVAIGFLLTQLF